MAAKYAVAGDEYRTVDRKMREIKRQLDQDESPLNPRGVARALQTIIEGEYRIEPVRIYGVEVNYSLTIEEALKEAGCNPHAKSVHLDAPDTPFIRSEVFPPTQRGKKTIEIQLLNFAFEDQLTFDDFVERIEKKGARPATIDEVVALGGQYPNVPFEFHVYALGSVCGREAGLYKEFVPVLTNVDNEKVLGLYTKEDIRSSGSRWMPAMFAAVKE